MYTALARVVLDETDRERVAEEVRRLRERHPKASRDELAGRLIRKAALRCAAASGILTGPAAFFGAMPFGADLAYQAVALNRLDKHRRRPHPELALAVERLVEDEWLERFRMPREAKHAILVALVVTIATRARFSGKRRQWG